MTDDDTDYEDPNDITPLVGYVKSLRAASAHYPLLLAEAFDNAFDAGATEIVCKVGKSIEIQDNGPGVPAARQKVFFQLGRHQPTGGATIGRYGMGMKVQAIAAGAVLRIVSATRDGDKILTFGNRVDWDHLKLKGGKWKLNSPMSYTGARRTGTAIYIEKLDRSPTSAQVQKCREEITRMFFPAFERMQITFNDEPMLPLAWPEMTDVIEGDVLVRPGKGARVRAGMLKIPGGLLSQAALVYMHRALKTQTPFGCGSYQGLTNIFVRIDLFENEQGEWQLSPFKDGLKDEDADELEDHTEDLLRPLLEKCEAASIDVVADEMADQLTENLAPELHPARPRKKGGGGGGGGGGGKRGKTRDPEPDPKGPAQALRTPYLRIEFVDGLHREFGIGKFAQGRKLSRIQFAKDDPWIRFWLTRRDRDHPAALAALHMAALSLYTYEKDQVQADLFEPYGLRLSRLLQRQTTAAAVDGAA
jgi:Histidine kinase-, DNA gyrase B-, and HSP90-like ATPase